MTDRFTDRVAELAGQTTRTLKEVAAACDDSGLVAQASTLRNIADLHAKIALDCLTETQPIEVERYNLIDRIQKTIEEIEEISADLLTRGKKGHSELSEAASILHRALAQQDQ